MKFSISSTLICIAISLILQNNITAQTNSFNQKQNQIYLELAGNSLIYSISYERLLTENFTLRGGFGITPGIIFVDGTYIHIPFSVSYLIGNENSKFEIGIGATYFAGNDVEVFGLPAEDESLVFLTGIVGYRYISPGEFVFRIFFTPLYSNEADPDFVPFGGLSFGFMF